MNDSQLQVFKNELAEHLEDVVRATVNGKIDHMQKQNNLIEQKMDIFIKRAEPVITTFENLDWAKRAIVYIGILAGAIISIGTVIKLFFINYFFK